LFGNQIYLIEEAKQWEVVEGRSQLVEADSAFTDPLIVGVRDKGYLIDQFNCTPSEEYAAREFSFGPN
jgi:hypothetical protein